ncbi:MAG: hypothetical protein IT375_10045 [Polyangiaceae bacterium]|nr:hypothetical protein [Polyangiaceae bacterium]MCK6533086.1 hypothetical protein [Polyangiaceae bacterium]
MPKRSALILFALGAVLAQACSSSSDGSSGTGYVPNPALCQASCSAATQSGCNTGGPSQCEADCEATRQKYSECLAEVDAMLSCASQNGYVCGSGSVTLNGCDAETKNFSICGACIPTGSSGLCTICAKKSCCAEYRAFGQAPDLGSYSACVQNCSSLDCLTACEQANPLAGKAFKEVDGCRKSACPSACDGQPSNVASDPVGRMCAAAKNAGCPITDCESTFAGQDSEPFGCGLQKYAAMECAASKPVTCQNGEAVFDESCLTAYSDCLGVGGSGGQSGGGGSGGAVVVGGAGGAIVGGSGGSDGG